MTPTVSEPEHEHGAAGRQARRARGRPAGRPAVASAAVTLQRADRHEPEGEVAVAGEPAGDDRVVAEQAVELERRAGEDVGEQRAEGDGEDGEGGAEPAAPPGPEQGDPGDDEVGGDQRRR